MEFSLKTKDNVFPCVVTIDEDNGRYMIRKSDSSGEVFNSAQELVNWVVTNWDETHFTDQDQFHRMLKSIQQFQQAQ